LTAFNEIGKHPNIIRIVEIGRNCDRVFSNTNEMRKSNYLAFEYAPYQELLEYFMSLPGFLQEKWIRYWFRKILAGLTHIN
jgi:serine/threonine protein kinase